VNSVFGSNRILPRVLVQVLPATVIVLLVVGLLTARLVYNVALDQQHTRLERVAAQSSTAIAIGLQSIIDSAKTVATNDLVINSLVDTSERDQYIPPLFQSLRLPGPAFGQVTLADYRGRRIASNTPGVTYADAHWVADVMEGHSVVKVTVKGLIVAIPVEYSGLPEGIIVVDYDAGQLARLVQLPIQADVYAVTTRAGGVIFSSNGTFENPANALHDDDAEEGWVRAEARIAGFPNLRLAVGDSRDGALAPVERRQMFVLFGVLLSVTAVVTGIFATASLVANPIKRFMTGVERVGGSADLAYRMEPSGSDEFRQLTESFNNMLSQVESMTRSRDYVDSILNSMTELMLVVAPDGRIRSANRATGEALDSKGDDLFGRNVSTLLSGDWAELVHLLNVRHSSVQRELSVGTGTTIPVLVSVSPLHRGGGDSTDLILVLNDITEQNTAKVALAQRVNELERSNADLERFAYVASHDLKAPLRAIDNLAGWLEEDLADHISQDSQEHMKLLRGRIARLGALLDGLLQYARAGSEEAKPTVVDTGLLVPEVVEMLAPKPSLVIKISETLPTMTATEVPLKQVFQNLISNAIKHHDRDEGTIEISSRDLGSHFEFTVSDDGPGIPEQYQERIFEMFQTLMRRDEIEGSGIGLAVVEKLVRAYGGTVAVTSPVGDRGAAFHFTWAKTQAEEVGEYV
jgi:PAS domain S-box-containing protein